MSAEPPSLNLHEIIIYRQTFVPPRIMARSFVPRQDGSSCARPRLNVSSGSGLLKSGKTTSGAALDRSRRLPSESSTTVPMLTFAADAFNLLNRVNDSAYIGTLTSPFFGTAVSASGDTIG